MELNKLIKDCIKGKRKAQRELHDTFSPMLYAVIKRYIKNNFDAEDILIDTFMKIFSNLKNFKNEGSFEAWMKKIAIRECLMFLRKNKVFNLLIEADNLEFSDRVVNSDILVYEELIGALDMLPAGYRTVFNLYVIEGYKHKEISKKLGISINTSKSQLRLAKQRLSKLINTLNKVNIQ